MATHFYRLRGLAVSEKTIRMFWRTSGVRLYRPTYRPLKADPARQAAAQQDLQAF